MVKKILYILIWFRVFFYVTALWGSLSQFTQIGDVTLWLSETSLFLLFISWFYTWFVNNQSNLLYPHYSHKLWISMGFIFWKLIPKIFIFSKKISKDILTYGKLYYIIILIKKQYKKIVILKTNKKENLSWRKI